MHQILFCHVYLYAIYNSQYIGCSLNYIVLWGKRKKSCLKMPTVYMLAAELAFCVSPVIWQSVLVHAEKNIYVFILHCEQKYLLVVFIKEFLKKIYIKPVLNSKSDLQVNAYSCKYRVTKLNPIPESILCYR